MRLRFSSLTLNRLTVCLALIVLTPIGSLAQTPDLPSGLPKNLSDNSAYEPCLGTFCGQSPPRCPWYVEVDAMFLKTRCRRVVACCG